MRVDPLGSMGNITTGLTRSRRAAEVAARIGVRLSAQRVEIYGFVDDHAELVARWGQANGAVMCAGSSVPLAWFPWSLGNIRPEEYMFIRNAGALALGPGDDRTIADLGMASVVHLPVVSAPAVAVGAICAYWSDERSSWDSSSREVLCSWAFDALSIRR